MSNLRTSTANGVANLPSAAAGAPILEPATHHFIDALVEACGPPRYALTPQAGADRRFTARELLLKVSAAR
jgi:hypothetical protein